MIVIVRRGLTMKISVSVNEACSMIGIGRTKLYEAIKGGRLKAFKCGKRTLIKTEDINAFISELEAYPE